MASVAQLLDQALRAAAIPIVGVSIGDTFNRATWTVQFLPAATASDRASAATVVTTVVVDTASMVDADAIGLVDDKVLKAVVMGLWEAIPAPTMTKAQLRTRILAILKTL